jgi:hypothetical protein
MTASQLVRIRKGTPIYDVAALLLRYGATADDAHQLVASAMAMAALEQSRGNICKAASIMDVHRNTLTKQLALLNLKQFAQDIRAHHARQMRLKLPRGESARAAVA